MRSHMQLTCSYGILPIAMQHDKTEMSDGAAEPVAPAAGRKGGKPAGKGSDRVQFAWLNGFRRERRPMEVFLVNGHRIAGRIRSFDQRAILLEGPGGDDILLLHHVISTIQPARGRGGGGRGGGGRPSRGDSDSRPPRPSFSRQPHGGEADDEPIERAPAPAKKPTVTIVRKHRRIVRDD
ncbi:MAG: RNA chaperone Hfq [Burkholderiaceae bacterium]|nr:RNA chaperone Hfq [Burkholderiaceae bacterium]